MLTVKMKPSDHKQHKTVKKATSERGTQVEADVIMSLTSLSKILRHGLRFANPAIPSGKWAECMGFLLGDVRDGSVLVKDAIPMTNGNRVEVRFSDDHYRIADEINSRLSEDLWVVGWYHTHPGHGLFLSPVDKENHSGYQMVNPHAIAIVFDPSKLTRKSAPSLREYMRIYRLRSPKKMERSDYEEIKRIKLEGSFTDLVTSLLEVAVLHQKGAPILLEYKEEVTSGTPSDISHLEEMMREMHMSITDMKREMADFSRRMSAVEEKVLRAITMLVDDEELE